MAPVLLVATGLAGLVFSTDTGRGEIVISSIDVSGARGHTQYRAFSMERVNDEREPRQGDRQRRLRRRRHRRVPRLQAALNTIWRLKPNAGAPLKAFVIDRLRSFGLVVAIGFLLVVSLAVTATLAAFSAWLSRHSSSVPLTSRSPSHSSVVCATT